MALFGDDCYFYYYSTCTKGTMCPYRHVPEARGNETSCTLWKAGHCSRPSCRFRHMEITVDRSNIPCYWETQPSGCAKPHCPFKHFSEKQEVVQDTERSVVPPVMKGVIRNVERSTPSPTNQYSRSSPKIDPVVVNPISDDSDEGSPLKKHQQKVGDTNHLNEVNLTKTKIISTKKNMNDVENAPSLKIKTLQEIRREKEMLQIINDSLEKPLDDELDPYKSINRSTSPTRKIVLDEPSKENNIITKTISTVNKEKSAPAIRGNVKSRLGRKLGDNKEAEDKKSTQQKSLSSRLGLSSLPKTKENKDEVAEIKIKSLEEIKLEKSKEKGDEQTLKKGIRKITMRDDDAQVDGNSKSLKVANLGKKRNIGALKTQNEQELKKSPGGTTKRNVTLAQERQKQNKLERAIYVPPGMKNTENNTEVSPTKKIHLAPNAEKAEDVTKVRVKTFAELMAEKRKKKEMEEASQKKASENIPKKSSKTNFTPIVFDLDQKERMAAPKVVAATLPFRHKKSALVAPLSSKTEIQKSPKTQIVKPVIASEEVSEPKQIKSVKEVPEVFSRTSDPSDKIMNQTVNKNKETDVLNSKAAKIDSSTVSETNVSSSQEKQAKLVETKSISNQEQCKEADTAIDQSKEVSSTINSAKVLKESVPTEYNVTPLAVKRKSSSLESESDKKKSRKSLSLTEDEALLFEDDDDNNFTLSSEKYDDDADILGDIDALLA